MNEQQFNNCVTLAKYLLSLPEDYEHFDMNEFYVKPVKPFDNEYIAHVFVYPVDAGKLECGAVACALGHGPAAGIIPEEHISWYTYSTKYFGTVFGETAGGYRWCFDRDWAEVDNTPKGAGKRIAFMLEKGLGVISDGFGRGGWSVSMYSDYEPNWDNITWDRFKNTGTDSTMLYVFED